MPRAGHTEFDGTYDGTRPVLIAPKAGRAVLWRNLHGHGPGECDRRTFHRTLPSAGGDTISLELGFHMRPFPSLRGGNQQVVRHACACA